MSRNGSGTYVLPAGQPVTNGTVIDATVFNTLTTDLANALTTSLSSDGQTVPTSNLPMGGLKHTGVAASTALTDYARTDQAQNSSFQWLTSVTGSDTIAASANPIPSSYAAGQKFRFIAAGTNTGAVTLNVNALGAKSVTKNGVTALSAGDISINSVVEVVYDGTQFQVGLGLGDVKKSDLQSQTVTAFTSSGSSPTFTVTTSPAYGALAAGQRMRVKFHAAGTTGSNTLNRDGLGAKNIMQYDSTGAKVSAVVASGQLVDVEYDGTDMVLLSPLPPTVATVIDVPVRQTVLGGPTDSSGFPSFLPATSGSLSITSQNITSSAPFVVASANGFGSAGATDRVGKSTANLTWSGLTASVTNYLYVDVASDGTLTAGSTTLAPVYQFGGTRSTTSGQATYNTQDGSMTVGNGSTAVQTYRVFVGEAVCGGSTVTSTVAYAYQGRYDSGWTNTLPASATPVVKNHNIGVSPWNVIFLAKCLTAEGGYAIGDITQPMPQMSNIGCAPIQKLAANTLTIMGSGYPAVWALQNATTEVNFTPTAANWAYKAIAQRGW